MRQNWDCSQIEDREGEEILEWHEEDELNKQLEEDQKMEERSERNKMDEGAWQVETMQKVLELVPHQRTSQCRKDQKERKK